MDVEDDSINITQPTCTSPCGDRDETLPLIEDEGVLHMIDCNRDEDLEYQIESLTSYDIQYHDRPEESEINQFITKLGLGYTRSLDESEIGYTVPQYAVLPDFKMGDKFLSKLQSRHVRVISTVLIKQCLVKGRPLVSFQRFEKPGKRCFPMFSCMMDGMTVGFTNFPSREDLKRMRWMVEILGGKVTREYDPMGKIILIANMAGRDKFETAMACGEPVLKVDWLNDCYSLRWEVNMFPQLMFAEDNQRYTCEIFYRFKFFLIGFKECDAVDIKENCKRYGAVVYEDASVMRKCTHVIVYESSDQSAYKPYVEELRKICSREGDLTTQLVTDKWFYESVSLSALLDANRYSISISPDGTLDFSSAHDRKRRVDELSTDSCPRKKRSSSEANCSFYSNISITGQLPRTPKPAPKTVDKRDNVISEFIRTEETYVRHLKIIEEKYYGYLYEQVANPPANNKFELELPSVHMMFQKVVPIRIVHGALLKELERYEVSEKLKKDSKKNRGDRSFGRILLNWIGKEVFKDENAPNGISSLNYSREEMIKIFQYDKNETRDYLRFDPRRDINSNSTEKRDEGEKRRDQEKRMKEYEGTMRKKPSGEVQGEDPDVLKHYNIYMNAHEGILDLINKNETKCFRFRSYLRTEGAKKENDRLSIRDLMIEPVQRLPRIILLLDAIIKKTDKKHGDLELLEIVREEFKKVTAHVNDSKRKLDQKKEFVNFLMQISGLPEGVISTSKHNLVEQYHFKLYREIGHIPADTDVGLWLFEGEDETTLYEYNDSILEIAYMPQKKSGSISSGSAERSLRSLSKSFCYKHILHIPLRTVTNVCQVFRQMDSVGLGVEYRPAPDAEKELLTFRFVADDYNVVLGGNTEKKSKLKHSLLQHVNRSKAKHNLPPLADNMELSEEMIGNIYANSNSKLSDSCKDLRSKPSFLEKVSGKVARALTIRQSNKTQSGPLQKSQSLANLTPSKKSESKVRLMRDSH